MQGLGTFLEIAAFAGSLLLATQPDHEGPPVTHRLIASNSPLNNTVPRAEKHLGGFGSGSDKDWFIYYFLAKKSYFAKPRLDIYNRETLDGLEDPECPGRYNGVDIRLLKKREPNSETVHVHGFIGICKDKQEGEIPILATLPERQGDEKFMLEQAVDFLAKDCTSISSYQYQSDYSGYLISMFKEIARERNLHFEVSQQEFAVSKITLKKQPSP